MTSEKKPCYSMAYNNSENCGGARGVMVIVVGNGDGEKSSKPERD